MSFKQSKKLMFYLRIANRVILVYPSPTHSVLNIEVKEQEQITILNVLGEVMKKETINGLVKIDVSAFNAGLGELLNNPYLY